MEATLSANLSLKYQGQKSGPVSCFGSTLSRCTRQPLGIDTLKCLIGLSSKLMHRQCPARQPSWPNCVFGAPTSPNTPGRLPTQHLRQQATKPRGLQNRRSAHETANSRTCSAAAPGLCERSSATTEGAACSASERLAHQKARDQLSLLQRHALGAFSTHCCCKVTLGLPPQLPAAAPASGSRPHIATPTGTWRCSPLQHAFGAPPSCMLPTQLQPWPNRRPKRRSGPLAPPHRKLHKAPTWQV